MADDRPPIPSNLAAGVRSLPAADDHLLAWVKVPVVWGPPGSGPSGVRQTRPIGARVNYSMRSCI